MNTVVSKKQTIISYVIAFVFILAMVTVSVMLKELPLVMNATEWSFIISILIFTILLILGVLVFRLNKGLEKKVQIQYKYMMVFLILNIVWNGLVWVAGYPKLAVTPPILVIVYEVLQKPMYNGKMAFKQGMILTISATVGTLLWK